MSDRVTIYQVAKEAGVSVATVSGILNHSDRQAPATAAKVRGVMQELGYVPRRNRLRRDVGKGAGTPRRVGLLIPDTRLRATRTPLARGLAEGLREVLAEQNVELSVFALRKDGHLPAEISRGGLEGLVVRAGVQSPATEKDLVRALEAVGLPTVWTFGASSSSLQADVVMADDRACGMWAADKIPVREVDRVFTVLPSPRGNLDIEYRAVAFDFHLRRRGLRTKTVTLKKPEGLRQISDQARDLSVAVFVPGHDHEVLAVHAEFAPMDNGRNPSATLIAVMTDETPLLPHVGERIHLLHIDPFRIGMAAGRQLLWRRQNAWAEPARLLVPAKELSQPARRRRASRAATQGH